MQEKQYNDLLLFVMLTEILNENINNLKEIAPKSKALKNTIKCVKEVLKKEIESKFRIELDKVVDGGTLINCQKLYELFFIEVANMSEEQRVTFMVDFVNKKEENNITYKK
jgi:hypothetical protein